jgi:ketosteroid isomerase-like protein
MTATTGTAQQITTEYVRAWLAGDADKALSFIADDVVCEAPSGTIKGLAGYRQFLTPFATALISGELIDVLADGDHAAAVYAVEAPFAKDFHGMEYLTVADGKISRVISVFDRLPAVQAQGGLPG